MISNRTIVQHLNRKLIIDHPAFQSSCFFLPDQRHLHHFELKLNCSWACSPGNLSQKVVKIRTNFNSSFFAFFEFINKYPMTKKKSQARKILKLSLQAFLCGYPKMAKLWLSLTQIVRYLEKVIVCYP